MDAGKGSDMISTLDFTEFGKRITQIRKEVRLTQNQVYERTGISEDTVRRIEKGLVIPKYETIELLSGLYKVDLVRILQDCKKDSKLNSLYKLFDLMVISHPDEKLRQLKALNQEIQKYDSSQLVNPAEMNLLRDFFDVTTQVLSSTQIEEEPLIAQLETALGQTIPDYRIDKFQQFRYSELELRVLLLAGLIYHETGQIRSAIPIYEFCVEYLKLTQADDALSSIQLKIKLHYSLSYACYKLKDDRQSLKYADLGIKLCRTHKTFYVLEMLLARRAIAAYYLKHDNYLDSFLEALHLLLATQSHDQIDYLIKATRSSHGIDLAELYQSLTV
ncbi:hypothetical protein DSECCO2_509970 [anaerobic digester metagenome]